MDKLNGTKKNLRVIGVEPTACPTLTKGPYAYDFGDTAGLTPLLKMYTLGHNFVPAGIHAGGLRYHGVSPIVAYLKDKNIIEAFAYKQNPCFEAALQFARTEGIIPAPETSHAIRSVIDEAIKAKQEDKEKVILFNFSGHGHFDLAAYENYLSGNLIDFELPEENLKKALSELPKI